MEAGPHPDGVHAFHHRVHRHDEVRPVAPQRPQTHALVPVAPEHAIDGPDLQRRRGHHAAEVPPSVEGDRRPSPVVPTDADPTPQGEETGSGAQELGFEGHVRGRMPFPSVPDQHTVLGVVAQPLRDALGDADHVGDARRTHQAERVQTHGTTSPQQDIYTTLVPGRPPGLRVVDVQAVGRDAPRHHGPEAGRRCRLPVAGEGEARGGVAGEDEGAGGMVHQVPEEDEQGMPHAAWGRRKGTDHTGQPPGVPGRAS